MGLPMKRTQSHAHSRFTVRPATPEDAQNVWLWRNDPATRAFSGDATPIPWTDHVDWFSAALCDPGCVLCMVMSESAATAECGDSIAVVRFDGLSETTECWLVSLNLRPESRGQGLGRQILMAACRAFFDKRGVQTLQAEINPHNVASRRVFSALGFVPTGRQRTVGFDLYERSATLLPKLSELREP